MDTPDRDLYCLPITRLDAHVIHSLVSKQLDNQEVVQMGVLNSLLNLQRSTKELTSDLH